MGSGMDIFGSQQPVAIQESFYEAYTDSTIKIELTFKRVNQNEHLIKAWFSNLTTGAITSVGLQVAVQKYMTLKLQQISKPTLGPNVQRDANQEMSIVNTMEGQKPLALKIRVTYTANGQAVDQTKVLSSLPTHY